MTGLIIFLVVFAGLVFGPLIALSSAPPVPGELMLIVHPDAERRAELVARANGRRIGPQDAYLAGFVVSDSPDFALNLKATGAWFIFDGRGIARLCGVRS